jgi:phage replication initiation protein
MKLRNTTGSNFTTLALSTDKCIIDYLTLSFDYVELERLKMQAKLCFQANKKTSFRDHYNALLTDEMCTTTDNILFDNITKFISQLNTRMSKHYQDLSAWRDASGEQFNYEDHDLWSVRNNHFGRFRYPHSASIIFDGVVVGLCCWGAKNFGAMISFTGQACGSINFKELHTMCKELGYVRITRVDMAYDDFEGEYNVDTCRKMFKNGMFTRTTAPSYAYHESGVLSERGKLIASSGRSFYVGKRSNGKMLRCYEKGKHLKDLKNINWVRWEVELRNIDREIPLDALINPSTYFSGSYPALERFGTTPERIKLQAKKINATAEHCIKYAVLHSRRVINLLKQVHQYSSDEIVNLFTKGLEEDDFPTRIKTDALILST